jgi:hypothetical protein
MKVNIFLSITEERYENIRVEIVISWLCTTALACMCRNPNLAWLAGKLREMT